MAASICSWLGAPVDVDMDMRPTYESASLNAERFSAVRPKASSSAPRRGGALVHPGLVSDLDNPVERFSAAIRLGTSGLVDSPSSSSPGFTVGKIVRGHVRIGMISWRSAQVKKHCLPLPPSNG